MYKYCEDGVYICICLLIQYCDYGYYVFLHFMTLYSITDSCLTTSWMVNVIEV